MRSESPSQLNKIDSIFKSAMKQGVNDYNAMLKNGPTLTLQLDRIGYRPSGATAEKEPLVQRALAAANLFTTKTHLVTESTNANSPISKSIPAITIGAGGKSAHEHSLEEWWLNEKGADGIKFVLLTILMEAGIEKK
jgi:tripeptide aminopeptidase